ncbi:phosphoribosylaminoimidazolesuccinocarboxamide synthase [Fundicoccus culcitae]|uniref:Phosphoribosylaminoimidazole-succinocarboxamide synthase n=1 Tax=Fundicoccus culcitae TaxID=2969821 RepID=A0ABY5P8D9_9LACT|nr:phosphoribosylaminoimidazolesuccinocarboxamide synthase [Fundicoccus culcitae]UUX35021.1 phosphoribosylaminoimidazolesuccinocarboxamide synthase [Fundicoccus culcitae]
MKLIYQGKTKDIYQTDDLLTLKFKDDVTGTDGQFDPGANQVGLSIEGMGQLNLAMSTYFFEKLNQAGVATHFVSSNIPEQTMVVKPMKVFGLGLEVITRFKATGSFIRRYGAYIEDGQPLDFYMEMTLKDDARQDPLVTPDALVALNIMTVEQYNRLVLLNRAITKMIKEDLEAKGLDLYDIKLEFGYAEDNPSQIVLIDEISGGNMRVYRGAELLQPLELAGYYTRD